MEWPLITLAENIRRQFLRRPVIVGEEIALLTVRVGGIDIGQALRISARQVPGEAIPRRADAELAFGQIDRFNSSLQRETERAEAVFGIDAVAIEFAGTARRDDQSLAAKDRESERIFARSIARIESEQTDDAPLIDENLCARPRPAP